MNIPRTSADNTHLTIATAPDDLDLDLDELDTPLTHSGETSPTLVDSETPQQQKKKKKKKSKKSAKVKSEAAAAAKAKADAVGRPPVLCISRNKHWRYISSYHGPWLQLPLELLESLLVINLDPATLSVSEQQHQYQHQRLPPLMPPPSPAQHTPSVSSFGKQRDRGGGGSFHSQNEYHTPPATARLSYSLPSSFPPPVPGKPTPPPIDPGVFRSVTSIRRLIDEASALSVRASSGLSTVELGPMGLGVSSSGSGLGGVGGGGGNGGRNVAMSAMRVHRLRALAVQKLAEAYKMDEIASSVMVMQGGSVFDDLAERVLKVDPSDPDARYVHFFHEKIPSRQLADSTTTQVLDELIASHPQHLEYLRTRGIVHCFRDEYVPAIKDFTHALKEARVTRRHRTSSQGGDTLRGGRHAGSGGGGKKKRGTSGGGGGSGVGQEETCDVDDDHECHDTAFGCEGTPGGSLQLHPSVLPNAPDPIEPQLLFLRGAAYLQHAVHLIESAVLSLEGLSKSPATPDGAELRLCYLAAGRYGGVEIGNPLGPLGAPTGEKAQAYRRVLGEGKLRAQVLGLVRKSMRDHERFLGHFDGLQSRGGVLDEGSVGEQMEWAFYLSESIRPGGGTAGATSPTSYAYGMGHHPNHPHHHHHHHHAASAGGALPPAATFTTYHPLLVESHFSVLLCLLMLADFHALIDAFRRTAKVVDGLEGYPVFLPPRSMGQAEFVEVLERLASGWRVGAEERPGARWEEEVWEGNGNGKARLAIEAPPIPSGLLGTEDASAPSGSGSGSALLSGSGSSSAVNGYINGAGSSSSSIPPPLPSPSTPTPSSPTSAPPARPDAADALDCARVLLAPLVKRQRERAEKKAVLERGLVPVSNPASRGGNAAADRLEAGEKIGAGAGINGVGVGVGAEMGKNGTNGLGAGVKNGAGAGEARVKAGGGVAKKPVPINIPLHGPRVEVILAWLGAVHLPELEEGA